MSGGAFLTTGALSIARGGEVIVSGVDLTLAPGEAIILRGGNGAGKSTLLRALAGLLAPAAGEFSYAHAGSKTPLPICEAVSYFGHENGLKAAMTVHETLDFWRRLESAPSRLVAEGIDALHLAPLLNRRTGVLSAGQRRRVGLARLLIEQRPVWLLDEPTSAMDAHYIDLTTRIIEAHCEKSGAAIVATHDAIDIIGATRLTLGRAKDTAA